MEVTNVSPSPTSRPEGDDLCEVDVTNVAIHSVTLLISLCGLAGNGAVLRLLKWKFVLLDIFSMVFIDFIFLLCTVLSALLFLVEDLSCSPILPLLYLNFLLQLSLLPYYWGLFSLIPSSIGVYINTLLKLCCGCQLSLHLWLLVAVIGYLAFSALFALIPTMTSLCPSQQQEHCRAALISIFSVILLLFAASMLISSTINFIKAKWGSQQQQPKKRDIVTFIIVLLNVLLNICNFLEQLGYIIMPTQVFFLLICIHSSIKPFIYFLAGRCWRPCSVESLQLSLQRVFEEQETKNTHRKNKKARSNGTTTDTVV